MSESKSQGEGKSGGASDEEEEVDVIDVTSIKFRNGSNLCLVEGALDFQIKFKALREITEAHWEVKVRLYIVWRLVHLAKIVKQYLVDSVQQRQIIVLGRTNESDYLGSSCSMRFQVDTVDVSHVKPSHLSNAGLLICTLFEKGTEVADIKMVVQVTPQPSADGSSEELVRCIYNPLE